MRRIALSLLSLSLATVAACKSKPRDEPAQKPVEGSAATASAGAGSAQGNAAPSPGSAATPGTAPVAAGSGEAAAAGTPVSGAVPAGAKSLLDVAKTDGRFSTLVKAIETAGLGERFAGAGPFTLLAPTDDAFAKVAPKDLEALLADKAKLEGVLQRHVLTGAVSAKDLSSQKAIKSLAGDELTVDVASGLKLQGATVVTPDLAASNGVIHAIDTVLLPPGAPAKEK